MSIKLDYKTSGLKFDEAGAKRIAFNKSQDLAKRMSESYANRLKLTLLAVKAFATRETYNSTKDEFVLSSPSRYLVQRQVVASRSIVFIQKGRERGKKPPPVSALVKWATALGIPQKYLFAIARKIGKRGIKPREVQLRTVRATKKSWESSITAFATDLIKTIFKPNP